MAKSTPETAQARYRQHQVWVTLELKLEALIAARYGNDQMEAWRADIVDWLTEAKKTKVTQQPALYVHALDELQEPLNKLETEQSRFKQYVGLANRPSNGASAGALMTALKQLPFPPPKNLSESYANQLDREMEARQEKLAELNTEVDETKSELEVYREEVDQLRGKLDELRAEVEEQKEIIKSVGETAEGRIDSDWKKAVSQWEIDRDKTQSEFNAEAAHLVGALSSVANHGRTLLDRAVGSYSATDWATQSARERKTADKLRYIAFGVFGLGIAVAIFVTYQALANELELTIGDAALRTTILLVIAAGGAIALRESNSHRRESNASQDMATSLATLAPFYENSDDTMRLAARQQVGDALLVKNVLSRFAHRDAARHAGKSDPIEAGQIADQVIEALELKKPEIKIEPSKKKDQESEN